jgi:hypothetical protein
MAITFAQALSAGNAVKLVTPLAPGSAYQRILCKTSDTFTGPDDANALTVADDWGADFLVDARDSLVDGQAVYYRAYDFVASAWQDQGLSFPATPATAYVPDDLLVQEFVRERLQLGLVGAVAAGRLVPASGAIPVMTAPFSIADNTPFPCVSVHLESAGQDHRVIGDQMEDFFASLEGDWQSTEGWLSREALNIVGVSQNADERIQMRQVLRQIIIANLPVFAGAGLSLIEFSQTDSEQFTENNVPLYLTNGSFSCVAPAFIRDTDPLLTDITINPGVVPFPPNQTVSDFYGDRSV